MSKPPLLPVLALCLLGLPAAGAEKPPEKYRVYVGTYTRGSKSQGVYRMELDTATGKLSKPVLAGKAVNPSFLAIHPTGKYLYAVEETGDFGKKPTGCLDSFAIDQETGELKLLNRQASGGADPCHLVLDKEGRYALAANYSGGSVCVLPIDASGKLGKPTSVIRHTGKSVNKARQEAPHPHSVNLDAANRFAVVADLGLDKVFVYRFDKGKLTANAPAFVNTRPGAGPRHFAFHPNGKSAYVINELASTITVFRYDPKKGVLEDLQTISTLPPERFKRPDRTGEDPTTGKVKPPSRFDLHSTTAEVVVHPSGRFLYGSNRGHDSIAVFGVDATTGQLFSRGHQREGIKTPRNFAVDPTGKFCLVANQDSDSVIVFEVDQKTGKLRPTKEKASIPRPVCLRFLAVKR
jgi:6-phosphogluconolactonase